MSETKDNMDILLNIQNQLGTVVATTTGIQEDIKELKEKDRHQSEELEKAYEKAKSRQDSIRDDLQHQIDSNHELIAQVKNSIDSLTLTISGIVEESKKNTETIIKDRLKMYDTALAAIKDDIRELRDAKKNKVYSLWEKIGDKIFWIIVAIVFAAVFKYLNITPPKMPV